MADHIGWTVSYSFSPVKKSITSVVRQERKYDTQKRASAKVKMDVSAVLLVSGLALRTATLVRLSTD